MNKKFLEVSMLNLFLICETYTDKPGILPAFGMSGWVFSRLGFCPVTRYGMRTFFNVVLPLANPKIPQYSRHLSCWCRSSTDPRTFSTINMFCCRLASPGTRRLLPWEMKRTDISYRSHAKTPSDSSARIPI